MVAQHDVFYDLTRGAIKPDIQLSDSDFLLHKAHRFMSVADTYLDNPEYKDIVAFNIHMALELSLGFVIEGLLRNYKYAMYSAYKREFPMQTTHNLSHVCCVLSNYVNFPTYLSFAVMQMSGWCVNSRYSEDFMLTIEQSNLKVIYNAVRRFLATLELLVTVKLVDLELSTMKVKGKITTYKGEIYTASETSESYTTFDDTIKSSPDITKKLFCIPQEDSKFLYSFMSNMEFTNYKHVLAKIMQYGLWTPEQSEILRDGLDHLHVDEYDSFTKSMGGYARKYALTEDQFNQVQGMR